MQEDTIIDGLYALCPFMTGNDYRIREAAPSTGWETEDVEVLYDVPLHGVAASIDENGVVRFDAWQRCYR